MDTIAKSEWLTALACPAMAWHVLRTDAPPPTEAEQFRMQQGREIGALARKLYPDGVMIPPASGNSVAERTRQYLADESKSTFFETTLSAGPLVAKADILQRQDRRWHVLEVKSRFSDEATSQDLVDDLAYTVLVFQRAGLTISRASLVLLSRDFRYGDSPERLFENVDVTAEVMARVASLDGQADKIAQAVLSDRPPTPILVPACRDCAFFHERCLGSGLAHTVLELPGLHFKKLNRLSAEGIIDLARLPDDLELNRQQQRARDAVLAGKALVARGLADALAAIVWPCYYLDFETVATVLPLYSGHACHQQVLTQFSLHRRETMGAEPEHREYLADAAMDCQRELAEALIAALGEEGAIVVYSGFEKTRIKALRAAFPDLAEPLDAIIGRLADLLFYVTEFLYHPDFRGSFSIKRVLPVLVPELSYKGLAIRDGDTAITRFARMARGEITGKDVEPTRQQLLEYCRLDTFAMVSLHDALHRMSTSAATAP